MSKCEIIINALYDKLKQIKNIKVYKNEPFHQKVSDKGIIFLRDGTIEEAEYLLSPPQIIYNQIAEVEVLVQEVNADKRDSFLSQLISDITQIILEDSTLSGTVDFCYPQAHEILLDVPDGAIPIKGAIIPIFLEYLNKQ